jgi:hypothetical protein
MGGSKPRPRRHDGRFDLRHGPYHPPRARIGSRLFCEYLGTVKVCKISDGPIPWPVGRTVGERGGSAFVLRGDLVRAVRLEANEAVARAWGVHPATVSRWRRILGVEQYNPGTHELFLNYQGKGLTAEATARGRALQTPEKQVEWAAVRRKEGRTRKRQWTPGEDALLGTMPDPDLARRIGCSDRTVKLRRRELGVAPFIVSPAAAASLKASAARLRRFSPEKMRARRLKLGLFQTQAAARCGWKTSAMYQRLEAGLQRRATPQVLDRVARALECRVKDLLGSK